MTDHKPTLLPGHVVTIRRNPRTTKNWISDGIVYLGAEDSVEIAALEAPEPPPPPPPPPPPAGVTRTFGPGSITQIASAVADNSVDTILLRPGTYSGRLTITTARSRPVVIRPESGPVTFDGGGSGMFLFFKGASNITLKDVKITNYRASGTGVIVLQDGAHHVTFDGLDMTGNITATANDHLIYPAGYTGACHDITIQNCTLDGAKGGAVHVYHDGPGTWSILVKNNRITNSTWGIIAAAANAVVTATGNTFSGNRSNMLAYFQSPYFAKIIASGNSPDDKLTTSW